MSEPGSEPRPSSEKRLINGPRGDQYTPLWQPNRSASIKDEFMRIPEYSSIRLSQSALLNIASFSLVNITKSYADSTRMLARSLLDMAVYDGAVLGRILWPHAVDLEDLSSISGSRIEQNLPIDLSSKYQLVDDYLQLSADLKRGYFDNRFAALLAHHSKGGFLHAAIPLDNADNPANELLLCGYCATSGRFNLLI
ncbi:hypothetical protein NX059_012226 [Plenodomus lindquistii]|nr:hypothetical protein NX059_012226 [Plenodomus lindquistii]